jgi:hypothetical protein
MRQVTAHAIAVIVLIAGFTACKSVNGDGRPGSNFAAPEANDAALAAGFSADELVAARKLYKTKCARCHKFYNPADYEEKEWQIWMRKMSKKSKLNGDQEQLLSRYLSTFRASGVHNTETSTPRH